MDNFFLFKKMITSHEYQGFINIILAPGGGTPLYGLYRYVRPFFSRFGHKLGIDFSHFDAILVINRV